MTVEQANEARLLRESTQFSLDKPGWFTLAVGTQETEVGFIFSVMSEVNQPGGSGKANAAQVRVNWWQYWFSEFGSSVKAMLTIKCMKASQHHLVGDDQVL